MIHQDNAVIDEINQAIRRKEFDTIPSLVERLDDLHALPFSDLSLILTVYKCSLSFASIADAEEYCYASGFNFLRKCVVGGMIHGNFFMTKAKGNVVYPDGFYALRFIGRDGCSVLVRGMLFKTLEELESAIKAKSQEMEGDKIGFLSGQPREIHEYNVFEGDDSFKDHKERFWKKFNAWVTGA